MATTPVARVLIILITATSTLQDQFAQECRVYQLKGNTEQYATPLMPIQNLFTVSFYNQNEGDFPNNTLIFLAGIKRNMSIFINAVGEVSMRIKDTQRGRNFTLEAAHVAHTWVSLAILIQDQNILIYRTDKRESFISVEMTLGPNVTAKVTTSQDQLYVTLNCPAGCLMYDKNSPLLGRNITLGDGVNLYIRHEEAASSAILNLGFVNKKGKPHRVKIDVTKWKDSLWHKVNILHDKEKHVIVTSNGGEVSRIMLEWENITFAVENATSVLWSLHCYPDHATGLEGWANMSDTITDDIPSEDKDDGAGIAEVLAWVLAGMAMFLVAVMALLLCTRMGPRTESMDYGASVGVVNSYGRDMPLNDAVREAEEDTEPDSPTIMTPAINHKIPEEEDEHQSNTKML